MSKETMEQWKKRVMAYSKKANPYKLKRVPKARSVCYAEPKDSAAVLNMLFKHIGNSIREYQTEQDIEAGSIV